MTKRRSPLTIEAAVSRIIGEIDLAELAAAVSDHLGRVVRPRTVYRWSDPDAPERCPAEAIVPLDAAWRAAGHPGAPLLETVNLLADAHHAERFRDAAALAQHAIKVIKEGGEAHAAIVAAAQPGASPEILREAAKETQEAIDELTRTLPLLTKGTGQCGASAEGKAPEVGNS